MSEEMQSKVHNVLCLFYLTAYFTVLYCLFCTVLYCTLHTGLQTLMTTHKTGRVTSSY